MVMFDDIFKTLEETRKTLEDSRRKLTLQQKLSIIQFIVSASLQYGKDPEEIVKLMKKALEALKKL